MLTCSTTTAKNRHINDHNTVIITPQPQEALHTVPERRYDELTIIDPIIGIGPQELDSIDLENVLESPGIVIINAESTALTPTGSRPKNHEQPETDYEKYIAEREKELQPYLDSQYADDEDVKRVYPDLLTQVLNTLSLQDSSVDKTVCIEHPEHFIGTTVEREAIYLRVLNELALDESNHLLMLDPHNSALTLQLQTQYRDKFDVITALDKTTGKHSAPNADSPRFEISQEHESVTSSETVHEYILEYNENRVS